MTLAPMIDTPSPNFNARKSGILPDMIVLHYTDMPDVHQSLAILQSAERAVSSHYVVDVDGTVYRLVPDEMRAWHAGVSFWDGESDINSRSIGIEIQNTGHQFGYVDFPRLQMDAVASLCRDLMARHNIKPHRVIGHSDVAPMRKADPGEKFPWQSLAAQGIGHWPQPTNDDLIEAARIADDTLKIRSVLGRIGYDMNADDAHLFTAFHRHYAQDRFFDGSDPARADEGTAALAVALHRMKLAVRTKMP